MFQNVKKMKRTFGNIEKFSEKVRVPKKLKEGTFSFVRFRINVRGTFCTNFDAFPVVRLGRSSKKFHLLVSVKSGHIGQMNCMEIKLNITEVRFVLDCDLGTSNLVLGIVFFSYRWFSR